MREAFILLTYFNELNSMLLAKNVFVFLTESRLRGLTAFAFQGFSFATIKRVL